MGKRLGKMVFQIPQAEYVKHQTSDDTLAPNTRSLYWETPSNPRSLLQKQAYRVKGYLQFLLLREISVPKGIEPTPDDPASVISAGTSSLRPQHDLRRAMTSEKTGSGMSATMYEG